MRIGPSREATDFSIRLPWQSKENVVRLLEGRSIQPPVCVVRQERLEEIRKLLWSSMDTPNVLDVPRQRIHDQGFGTPGASLARPPLIRTDALDKDEAREAVAELTRSPRWELASRESSRVARTPERPTKIEEDGERWRNYKWHLLKREKCPQLAGYKYGKYQSCGEREEATMSRKRETQALLVKAGFLNVKPEERTSGSFEVSNLDKAKSAEKGWLRSCSSVFEAGSSSWGLERDDPLADYTTFIEQSGPVVDESLWGRSPLKLNGGIRRLPSILPRARSQLLQTRKEDEREDTVDGCTWWLDEWFESWDAGVRQGAVRRLRCRQRRQQQQEEYEGSALLDRVSEASTNTHPSIYQMMPFKRAKFNSLLPHVLIRRSGRLMSGEASEGDPAPPSSSEVGSRQMYIPLEAYAQQPGGQQTERYYDQLAYSDEGSTPPMPCENENSDLASAIDMADVSDPVAIRRLLRKVQRYLKKVARIQTELQNTKEEVRSANADMDAMRNDIAYLQEDLDQKLALEKKLLTERNGSKQKEAEMMKLVKKVYGEDPAEVYDTLLNTNEEMQNEMDAVIDERDDLCQQVEKLQEELDTLQRHNGQPAPVAAGDDGDEQDTKPDEDKQRVEELLARAKRLEGENADLREELQKRRGMDEDGSSEGSRGVIQALAQENVELKQQLKSREAELSGLRADLKDYEEGKEGGEAGAEVDGEVERLREELRKLQQQHDELWTHLNEALEEKWNMEEKLQGLRAQIAEGPLAAPSGEEISRVSSSQGTADTRQADAAIEPIETQSSSASETPKRSSVEAIVVTPATTAATTPSTEAGHGPVAGKGAETQSVSPMSIGSTVEKRPRTSANLARLMYTNKSIEAFDAEVSAAAAWGAYYVRASSKDLEERYKQQIKDAVASRDKQIQALEARLRVADAAVAEKDAMLLTLNRDILDKERRLSATARELEVAKRHLQSVAQRYNLRFGVDPFSGLSGYYAVTDTPAGWPSSGVDENGGGVEGGCRPTMLHNSGLNDSLPSVLIPDEFDSILSDGIISAEENAYIRTAIKTKHARKDKDNSPHGLLIGAFSHRNWSKSQPATPSSQPSMRPLDRVDDAVQKLVEALRSEGVAVPSVERTPTSRAAGSHHYLIGGEVSCGVTQESSCRQVFQDATTCGISVSSCGGPVGDEGIFEESGRKCPMKAMGDAAFAQVSERSKVDQYFTTCRDWASRHLLRLPVPDLIRLLFAFAQNDDREGARELARRVLIRQEELLEQASGRDLARLLSTLATLGVREHETGMTDVFEAAFPALAKRTGQMRSYQIIAICGAYKKVGIFDNELAATLARRAMVLGDDDNQFAAFRALLGVMGNLSVRIDREVLGRLVDAAAAHEQQGEICAFRLAVLLQICTKLGLEDHHRFYIMMHSVASEVPKWPAQPTKPLVDTLNHLMLPLVCQYRSDGDGQELYDLKERLLGAVVEYLAQSGVGPSRLDTYCQINLCVIELHIRLERPLLWCALSQRARGFLAVVSQLRVNNQYDALPTMSSQQHLVVSRELSDLEVSHTLEVALQQPYLIDVVISNSRKLLEIDGPRHFINGTERPTVTTELKHRLLTRLGYDVRHIRWDSWPKDALHSSGDGPKAVPVSYRVTETMPKRAKGLSLDQKKAKLHEALMAEQSFYNFKEIEKIAKKCGIVPQSVKEVVQHLVDGDRLVSMEKVGSQNIYWALPSSQKAALMTRLDKTRASLQSSEEALAEAEGRKEEISSALGASGVTQEKSAAMRVEFEELEGKRRKLTADLEALEATDPSKIKEQIEEMRRSRDLLDIWTDNICTVRQFIATRGGMSEEQVDKEFGIDPTTKAFSSLEGVVLMIPFRALSEAEFHGVLFACVGHRSDKDRPTPTRARAGDKEQNAARSRIAALNRQATRDLQEGSMASCIAHLREAEALAAFVSDISFHAMTLNNMASYYRAIDKPHIAMRFLVRALRLEMGSQGPSADLSVAGTHLNISSLEHLGRRREALTAYRRGLRLAVEHLPSDAEVIEVLNVACDQLSKKRELSLSGGNSLSISPRSSPVSDARKGEAFTDLRCPPKTIGEGHDSPTQQVVRRLGREYSTDLGSLPPFILDVEARPSCRRVEEEELPPLVLVGEVGCKGEQPRVQNSPSCHMKLVLREEDVVEADRTIQRPVRRRRTAGEEQERREEELTQQSASKGSLRDRPSTESEECSIGRRVTESNGSVSCPAGSLCAKLALPTVIPALHQNGRSAHYTIPPCREGARLKKVFGEGRLTPRDRRPRSRVRLGGSRGQAAGIEGGDILSSASPVGEADEVSLAGLSSRSDALGADGSPPAAVLLPRDEHLDDGELFFPRDVQDGYVSWTERR
ncbi:Meiotic nuclear division protein 1 [Perkinsus olseni]|uniref:Meiotic nuclear division protein 1 n=1 Tax=Perkinsus olseni TaxID=32597 RepID=A0A7J6MR15_PEROL|nr:Meiotic nuclear division protein 1 [Perkinsus olseni]